MDRDSKQLAGMIIYAVFAGLTLAGAYGMWPANFFSTAFADMTPAMLLRAAATLALAIAGLEFLAALALVSQSDH